MQRRAVSGDGISSATPLAHGPTFEDANGDTKEGDVQERSGSLASDKPLPDSDTLLRAVFPAVLSWGLILSLIFGGCCSNVFALEAIIKADPDAGLLLTFAQFLPVVLFEFPKHVSLSSQVPFIRIQRPKIPLWRWIPSILMFFAVNLLNNHAFRYSISVPVHIILRSGGSVLTMIVGYASGKRFRKAQILGVVLLTVGVVTAAMADSASKGKPITATVGVTSADAGTSAIGFLYLFIAALTSAFMGLYVQSTYAQYGPHWQENLFYSHALSLPLFMPWMSSLSQQFNTMQNSSPWTVSLVDPRHLAMLVIPGSGTPRTIKTWMTIPEKILFLVLNAFTQYGCIRGVNLLAARSTALGVTIVLNIRKLVSLLLSIWLFGNRLPAGVILGATVVFAGAGVYGLGGSPPQDQSKKKKDHKTT